MLYFGRNLGDRSSQAVDIPCRNYFHGILSVIGFGDLPGFMNPTPLEFGKFYHVYNRGNNRENIFIQPRNYTYFMELWWKHTYEIAETFAFCLLKNHFHAVVYIKEIENFYGDLSNLKGIHEKRVAGVDIDLREKAFYGDLTDLKKPSQYFANFFNAYAHGANIAVQRTGALFKRPFGRIEITNEKYLLQVIVYIHQNPQKHQFVNDFCEWDYSSYHDLIATIPTRLVRDKVMSLFGGRDEFLEKHREIQPMMLEDEV